MFGPCFRIQFGSLGKNMLGDDFSAVFYDEGISNRQTDECLAYPIQDKGRFDKRQGL
jgi:hypothetical protein